MDEVGLTLVETDLESIPEVIRSIRRGFQSRRTFPLDYRLEQLKCLKIMIGDNLTKLLEAAWIDLRKAEQEVLMSELNVVTGDIDHAVSSLSSWMAPEYVPKDLLNKFNSAYIQSEPYGVVLIISPWNYPLMLSLQPLVGAIASGNACVLKLSEYAVATSNILAELLPSYLDKSNDLGFRAVNSFSIESRWETYVLCQHFEFSRDLDLSPHKECFGVVTGGVDVAVQVSKQRFDYIFFTGSTNVGRSIMKSAAENLTPLTLELGGKSPCIVADDANLEMAARRIVWGKCLNAGQSCVSPDYILCSLTVQSRLSELCKATIRNFFGEDPKLSPDYGRIINSQNFGRISSMLESVRDKIFYGGESDAEVRYIAPTILTNVTEEDTVMSQEIFGPLLPFVVVDSILSAVEFINRREKPLALYLFTNSVDVVQAVTQQTSSGGVTHNDTMMHYSVSTLPFGGVGHSGFGSYHGKYSFDAFSHRKAVLSTSSRSTIEGLNNIRYPPYSEAKLNDLQRLQTEGGVSRVFRLASLLTRSATGRARHRHASPVQQQESDHSNKVALDSQARSPDKVDLKDTQQDDGTNQQSEPQ